MAIKQTLEDSKSKLDALLVYANGVTGAEDANIGDAIKTLCDGYGGSYPFEKFACTYFISDSYFQILNSTGRYFTHNLGEIPKGILIFDADWEDNIPQDTSNTSRVLRLVLYHESSSGEHYCIHSGVRNLDGANFTTNTYASDTNASVAYDSVRNITKDGFMLHPYTTVNGIAANHRYFIVTWR